MSNKLKKYSKGYEKAKQKLINIVEEKDGINLTPKFMKENFTDISDEDEKITEDEFYSFLSELAEGDEYKLYKIERISKGKLERGMMLCNGKTELTFMNMDKVKAANETAKKIADGVKDLAKKLGDEEEDDGK